MRWAWCGQVRWPESFRLAPTLEPGLSRSSCMPAVHPGSRRRWRRSKRWARPPPCRPRSSWERGATRTASPPGPATAPSTTCSAGVELFVHVRGARTCCALGDERVPHRSAVACRCCPGGRGSVLLELADAGHFAFLDVQSTLQQAVCSAGRTPSEAVRAVARHAVVEWAQLVSSPALDAASATDRLAQTASQLGLAARIADTRASCSACPG